MVGRVRTVALALGGLAVLVACADSGNEGSAEIDTSEDIKGQTISVLMPPWAEVPESVLQQFTDETGVKVDYNIAEWDAIRDKIAVAGAANSELADVTEFDWSWTGQYGRAGWFVPLQDHVDSSGLENNDAFTLDGNLYGACYHADFRLFQYNERMFEEAGIDGPPATFDEVLDDARTLKEKGVVEYPLAFPLQSEESTSMTWYLLVLAFGGELIDENGEPGFEDPQSGGYQALQFYKTALDEGLINPAAASMSDEQHGEYWRAGNAAISYATPGDFVANDDPSQSKIVGEVKPMLVPGVDGPGTSYGLPEAIGVMSSSEHKAAALAFVKWWMTPETQRTLYDEAGIYPCHREVFEDLVSEGELAGGNVLLEQLDHVGALFPHGAPEWYSKFSTEASSQINAMAKGNVGVDQAIAEMADTLRQFGGN